MRVTRSVFRPQHFSLLAPATLRVTLVLYYSPSRHVHPNTVELSRRPYLTLDSRSKCNRLSEPDLHVFAKLFEDRLERGREAQAFSWRQVGGDDDVLDFFVGHLVDVDLTRQPAA